jgi:hypothetical protein
MEREGFLEIVRESWNSITFHKFDIDKWQEKVRRLRMADEGMTNGPSTFAYLAFRSRRDAVEGISKPTKMIAWRGPRT